MTTAVKLSELINGNSSQIVVPSGGLNFGTDTDGSGTVTGGVLDDYEEGTYTVTLHDADSGGNQSNYSATASYVKIGNMVTVTLNGSLTFSNYNGSPSNLTSTNVLFWSLPFTPSSTKKASGSIVTSLVSFRNGADACLNPIHVESASKGRFRAYSSGDGSAFLRPQDFNGGSIQHLTMTYFTD